MSPAPVQPHRRPHGQTGGRMAERLDQLISERRIRARTAALARRIDADYRDRELCLLVVLKGAMIFAAYLIRRLTAPLTLDVLAASSYGGSDRRQRSSPPSRRQGGRVRGPG